MSGIQVLLVAGTHGNEINAPWLFEQWKQKDSLINTHNINIQTVIGNPVALEQGKRYVDRDLNRSFRKDLLLSSDLNAAEHFRALELVSEYGPNGNNPCQIAIDFHSTTSSMGSSLVVYGRRPADLAIVSLIQNHLGLPIYLHEGDNAQSGFLVESWPCGFVVEVGPVPQGLLHFQIINQTLLTLDSCLKEISNVINSKTVYPEQLIVHRHLKNIDFPRDSSGVPSSLVHKDIQGRDWYPIKNGHPLFESLSGDLTLLLEGGLEEEFVPVFINEAAYAEKNIAMSLTKKEMWDVQKDWINDLSKLLNP
ncbi:MULTISPECIES: aspartoacylase [Prochlorococcus]|uniref:Probable aspartoacylase n=1 Tax=Prochlorococcus marinus (strain SARG / CCMP1375 / SS120) TaxID=167539 RepID=ASPA_PROMA|nr:MULTISPECIES: aspartoacylase [Prochlorococcus]P72208.2 RecName: Full=Probable aspartoacylase [Prochlorococcus marinus subsp. marinus str. CCMP1375]AAP99297.1 Succinylglutamate desuccinylase [Prochlorococcus marinus subsp. marinus str. CCMP1375]KGG11431.1 putative aspartoacylase [Prochlorococcus marinus str. LG]KGG18613.1 putative aspartoacylase [Prochlorococcus marinus str. SS2]KGG22886.1 putative aspartoacylase [Prochlorococcus marinus str. SS35]KGG32762.1 putative aspartoacylase [Prochlo